LDRSEIFSPQIEFLSSFNSYNDSSRINMSSKQILQTVVSSATEYPFVVNKNYKKLTRSGSSQFILLAEYDGFIVYNGNGIIVIYYYSSENDGGIIIDKVPQTKSLGAVENALTLKFALQQGQEFKKGDVVYDYTNQDIKTGIPRIGYRAKILYSTFFGYNSDDALVVSESFAKKCTIDHKAKVTIPVTKELKYSSLIGCSHKGYIPKVDDTFVSDEIMKVVKIDNTNSSLSDFINISDSMDSVESRSIFGLKGSTPSVVTDVRIHIINKDADLNYPLSGNFGHEVQELIHSREDIKYQIKGEFKKYFEQDDDEINSILKEIETSYITNEAYPDFKLETLAESYGINKDKIDYVIEISLYLNEVSTLGDKFTNTFAGKGTIAKIIPDDLMPYDINGTHKIDVVFNSLGIFGRNNWGTIFESAITKIIRDIEKHINDKEYIIPRLNFIVENFYILDDDLYYNAKELVYKIQNDINYLDNFQEDVIKNGFYIYLGNFPGFTYNEFYQKIIEYGDKFNVNFGKSKILFKKELFDYLGKSGFQHEVFDVKEDVVAELMVSENYLLKLYHTSNSKYNAVSTTRGHNIITGQPKRGRKMNGGQHISWQSLAALLAHGNSNNVIKELYSLKSDAQSEKSKFNSKFALDGEYYLKPTYDSVTKNFLNNSLKMFGLSFKK